MRTDVQPGAWLAVAAGYVPSALRRLPRGEEVRMAPELRERWGDLKGAPVRMRSRAWRNEVVGWFRASFMDGGARVRVMSCLGLPRDAFDLPMFAAEVVEAFAAYLEEYLELVAEAEPRGDPTANRVSRRAYCDAHAENDPGARMLEAIFGEAWATRYAEAFLFRLDHG